MEAVFYDGLSCVFAGDGDGRKENCLGGTCSVRHGGGRLNAGVFGQSDGGFGGGAGFAGKRLVDGHELRAIIKARDGGEIGVLPGDEDLAGKIVVLERLNGTSSGGVIGGEDGGERNLQILQCLGHKNVGLRRAPFGNPDVGENSDVPAIDEGLQHFHLTRAHDFGIGIEWRAGEENVITLGSVSDQSFRLQDADGEKIESDVKVDVGILHEPVVTDDGHMAGMGGVDDAAGFLKVVRQ